jgi:DNA-binding NarL/FixJ family response regulator
MRSLVLIADEPAIVGRMRLATRYAAGVRIAAMLDGREGIAPEIAAYAPDVVVVDEMCQRMNTLARLQEIRDCTNGTTVLLLASARSSARVADAFAAGAHAVLSRDVRPPALGAVISEIACGRMLLSAQQPAEGGPAVRAAAPAMASVQHLRLVAGQDARRTGASA